MHYRLNILSFFCHWCNFKASLINTVKVTINLFCVIGKGSVVVMNPQRIITQLCSSIELFNFFLLTVLVSWMLSFNQFQLDVFSC